MVLRFEFLNLCHYAWLCRGALLLRLCRGCGDTHNAISFAGPAAFHDVISAGAMLCFILWTDLAIWLHGHPSGGLAFILQRIRAAIYPGFSWPPARR
jgi:hypothetical protein